MRSPAGGLEILSEINVLSSVLGQAAPLPEKKSPKGKLFAALLFILQATKTKSVFNGKGTREAA